MNAVVKLMFEILSNEENNIGECPETDCLALPSVNEMYFEIRIRRFSENFFNWSHPLIKVIAGKLTVDFYSMNDIQAFKKFKKVYQEVFDEAHSVTR